MNIYDFSPTAFPTNIALFNELEASGYGAAEMWKSRYKRDTNGFKVEVSQWRKDNGKKQDIIVNTYVEPTIDEVLDARKQDYKNKKNKFLFENRRRIFKLDYDWTCVFNMSDLHLDDDFTNVPYLFETVNKFRKFPQTIFANLTDINNWWQDAWAQSMAITSHYTPEDGYNIHLELLKTMGEQLKVYIHGNHENFALKGNGYDFIKRDVLGYSPDVAFNKFSQTVRFENNTTSSDWIKFAHQHLGGKSMYNPHQQNIRHLQTKESDDVNFTVTGHYHYPHAAYGEFPFNNRFIKSLLLGSIKNFDDYALKLGYSQEENLNIFGFIFLHDGIQRVITDVDEALMYIEWLNSR